MTQLLVFKLLTNYHKAPPLPVEAMSQDYHVTRTLSYTTFIFSCPGICPGLTDCLSCTIHGSSANTQGLGSCSWCSHLSTCTSVANAQICSRQDNSWWTEAVKISTPGNLMLDSVALGSRLILLIQRISSRNPKEHRGSKLASYPAAPGSILSVTN